MVFYNEHLSVLLRSIHSVLNKSPPQLLNEIILVDDGSDKIWLQKELQMYIADLPKIRLMHTLFNYFLNMIRNDIFFENSSNSFVNL